MNNEYNKDITIKQNLKDAGCNSARINNFLALQESGKISEQLYLLSEHRRLLLNAIHKKQKNLDCLDYLIFTIKK